MDGLAQIIFSTLEFALPQSKPAAKLCGASAIKPKARGNFSARREYVFMVKLQS
jgi:hypothetical protein